MQNQAQQNPLFSFLMVPNSIQYITLFPISPTSPGFISPTSDLTFASMCFPSGQINQLYCRPEPSSIPSASTTSIVEHRQVEQASGNSISIQNLQSQNNFTINRATQSLSCNGEASLVLQGSNQLYVEFSSVNKKQKIKQSGPRIKEVSDQDKQYVPRIERKKRDNKYQQNQNRNIIPNEINQIFSFIQKHTKSGYLLDKLFKRFPHPPNFSPKRFYLYQSLLKNKLGHYANEKSLKLVTELYEPKCESWPEAEQRFYNKLCRILIRHFLYEDSIFIILTSKRMKSSKKASHLRARRSVTQSVLQILKGF